MTGPEHYRRAEDLLNLSARVSVPWWRRRALRQRAHVHASLALVAATAIMGNGRMLSLAEVKAWADTAAVKASDVDLPVP